MVIKAAGVGRSTEAIPDEAGTVSLVGNENEAA